MQQGLGQARALGGGVGRREVKGEPHWCWTELTAQSSLEPPLQKGKAGGSGGGRPGSSRLGGGLGDHAADAQRLRVETGGPGQPGTEEARVAMGCGSLGASSHELCSHTVPGLEGLGSWVPRLSPPAARWAHLPVKHTGHLKVPPMPSKLCSMR